MLGSRLLRVKPNFYEDFSDKDKNLFIEQEREGGMETDFLPREL